MKAIFLDRDGTINVEQPQYLTSIEKLDIMDEAYDAIRLIQENHFKSIVVTNQSCVGRGLLEEPLLQKIHETMRHRLAEKKAYLDSIYYCPHRPDEGCMCRKPKTGMFEQAAREHQIDLKQSYMIGDKEFDILAGKNAGLKTVLVLTGGGENTLKYFSKKIQPDFIAPNILEAVKWILSSQSHSPKNQKI
ncbi:MAG: hypothetical protein A3B70_02045 [Deltaproteobacteria bacterium RIFCSPHIGHO2_02_FULL_40_11]|nr:MAG: hypothetical protein A3B70_02045 [Deltaproteobacteria bacterium RIFCSPHIGHO2_02_FULL_40_11]